jgi:peptidoglycan/LPS O-acetylase OafA/YrhL
METHSQRRIPELDGLRGIACMMVFLMHYFAVFDLGPDTMKAIYDFLGVVPGGGGHAPGSHGAPAITILCASGVDLFFVLSGFLISGILFDNANAPNYFRTFYVRRVCRIFPIYYLVFVSMLIGLALVDYVPAMNKWLLRDLMPLWSYATFTQTFFMAIDATKNAGGRWVAMTWSVAVEEHFYLIFPFIVRFFSRTTVRDLAILSLIAAPVCRVLANASGAWYYPLLPCRLDCISVGVLLAYTIRQPGVWDWLRANRLRIYGAMAMCMVGFVFFHDHMLGYTWLALFFGCVLLTVVVHPETLLATICRWRVLCYLGTLSYGIYMYHQAINGILHAVFFADEPVIRGWATFGVTLLSVLATALVSMASYHFVEKYLLRLGHRAKWQPDVKPAPAPVLAKAA